MGLVEYVVVTDIEGVVTLLSNTPCKQTNKKKTNSVAVRSVPNLKSGLKVLYEIPRPIIPS